MTLNHCFIPFLFFHLLLFMVSSWWSATNQFLFWRYFRYPFHFHPLRIVKYPPPINPFAIYTPSDIFVDTLCSHTRLIHTISLFAKNAFTPFDCDIFICHPAYRISLVCSIDLLRIFSVMHPHYSLVSLPGASSDLVSCLTPLPSWSIVCMHISLFFNW